MAAGTTQSDITDRTFLIIGREFLIWRLVKGKRKENETACLMRMKGAYSERIKQV